MRSDYFDFNTAKRYKPEEVGNDNTPTEPTILRPLPGPVVETERRARFIVEDFDTIQMQPAAWLVKQMIPRVGVQVVAGAPGSGKSFLLMHLAAAICRGIPVFGQKTTKSAGIYIASEDAAGVRLRMTALRQEIGPLGGTLRLVGQAPNLTDPEDVGALRELVEQQVADLQLAGHRLGFVVIDTLSASIPGADENTARDMSPVLAALQEMAQEFGVAVLLVAHTGKDSTKGVRGWSGVKANADGLILVEDPDADGLRLFTTDKVKNGMAGERFAFRLDVIQLGLDEDGDPITSCVVQEEHQPAGRTKAYRADPPEVVLLKQAYSRLLPDKAVEVPVPEANGQKGVLRLDLKREAFAMGFGPPPPDTADCPDPKERAKQTRLWEDRWRKAFDRALNKLVTIGGYRREGDYVWHVS